MEKTLDISSLPDKARAELMDFYQFLQGKYGCQKLETQGQDKRGTRLEAFLAEPIHVREIESVSRDSLHERR
jgi:hypothetical protein